ncbi:methylated-DNA--[protein]-cysteine S-methyltransferase [Hyphococcus flavus]|uniref:methylated-DNA--[protein]-cysteine S-methyltransferase n=1 Tax=Hyphococcus flavus TaxID=1866326 RepID=A0AAE9ZA50_9PROT|nr:methylated-DNA--[protein]-cysteine S-methyltransferase [Hyphococcus flavus]WDI30383.1 methylated-DNA--[protein]-cysteine S-methyltransferase [Hyphococcus flavus]
MSKQNLMNAMTQITNIAPISAKRLDGYAPVGRAIDFLTAHAEDQPGLEDVAAHVGLSPAHFQRVFKAGAGVSPKRFLQYLAAQEAKRAMSSGEDVLSASLSAGLSGSSRLHDLFLASEAMTPGDYRRKGAGLVIRHAFIEGPLGRVLIAATDKGVCWMSFAEEGGDVLHLAEMKHDWSAAEFIEDEGLVAPLAARAFAFALNRKTDEPLRLHVRGTNFQLKVWEALLKIPYGGCATYGDIAREIGSPRANRAVGSAVGANLISVLIPCHRVILSSGVIHNYRWGVARKKAVLAMEGAVTAA